MMKPMKCIGFFLSICLLLSFVGCNVLADPDAVKDIAHIIANAGKNTPEPAPDAAPVPTPEVPEATAVPAGGEKKDGPTALGPLGQVDTPESSAPVSGGTATDSLADMMLFTYDTDFASESTRPTLTKEDDGTAVLSYLYDDAVELQFCRYPGTYEDEADAVKKLIEGKLDDQRDATVTPMDVDGRKAWRVYFEYKEYGVSMYSASAVVLDQGWLYVFFSSTHEEKYDSYCDDIDKILFNLRIVQAEKLFGRWADTAFDEYASLIAGLWTAENPYAADDPYMFFFTEDGRFYETYAAFDNRGVYSEWGVTEDSDIVFAFDALSEGNAYRPRADTDEVLYCIRTNVSFDGDSVAYPMELDKSCKELRILISDYAALYLYPLNTREGADIVKGTKYEKLASPPESGEEEEAKQFAYVTLQNANIGKDYYTLRLQPMDFIGWQEIERLADYGIDPDTYDMDYALLPLKDAEVIFLRADKYGETSFEVITEDDPVFPVEVDPGLFIETLTARALLGNGEGMLVTYEAEGDFMTSLSEYYIP